MSCGAEVVETSMGSSSPELYRPRAKSSSSTMEVTSTIQSTRPGVPRAPARERRRRARAAARELAAYSAAGSQRRASWYAAEPYMAAQGLATSMLTARR
eukprot:3945823-Lingulodinium_polyedra.AAC.1